MEPGGRVLGLRDRPDRHRRPHSLVAAGFGEPLLAKRSQGFEHGIPGLAVEPGSGRPQHGASDQSRQHPSGIGASSRLCRGRYEGGGEYGQVPEDPSLRMVEQSVAPFDAGRQRRRPPGHSPGLTHQHGEAVLEGFSPLAASSPAPLARCGAGVAMDPSNTTELSGPLPPP
jgi:hypothetical protein